MAGVQLRSPAFGDHERIPREYGHERGDVSPPLRWSQIPEGTAELALTCEDPDAPGGTFLHWALASVSSSSAELPRGDRPEGSVAGVNDFGAEGYGGPHPPPGDRPHRYVFRLYALREPLTLPASFDGHDIHAAMQDKVISSGELVGIYAR